MSNVISPKPRLVVGSLKRRFVIVASQFNAEYVQGLVNHATDELRMLAPAANVSLHQVPGAFEIPIVVRELALQRKADAILALGVIIKGQTSHADNLARSVTDALQRIAIEHGVPVINGVLSVNNEFEARERCLERTINRGIEAARAAVEISTVLGDIRNNAPAANHSGTQR
jgi:6,7-dimethyl-8-ribityllumazine synthase